ncbi:MAG: phage major capsid protein [Pirellulales bacterium]|nr:phage major capsid protein [Pirellulales bacterium]
MQLATLPGGSAFRRFYKTTQLTDADRRWFADQGYEAGDNVLTRAMGVGVSGAGDKAVPSDVLGAVWHAAMTTTPVIAGATKLDAEHNGPLTVPTSDDDELGELMAENTQDSTQDVAISSVTLDLYRYTSKIVLASNELLKDATVSLERHLGELMGRRIGAIANTHLTTGDGTGKPRGIVTAATAGVTAAATTALTYSELVDLQASVADAYQERAVWMLNRSTLAVVKKLTDSNNQPVWTPTADGLGLILGNRFVLNAAMPYIGAGTSPALFGDLSCYGVRVLAEAQLDVFRQRYADFHQTGFRASMRLDGDIIDASGIRKLTMAAA